MYIKCGYKVEFNAVINELLLPSKRVFAINPYGLTDVSLRL